MKILAILTFTLFALASCDKVDPRDFEIPIDSTLFKPARPLAEVADARLAEVSGMVVSHKNPGHLWVHNDSGDKAQLYLINLNAQIVMTVFLEGIEAIDWEDMTWRKIDGQVQLIIGDIGDNKARRENIMLHIIDEPHFQGQEQVSITNSDIATINLTYQEGPRDAESLTYDHLTNNVILITKREKSVNMYEFDLGTQADIVISSKGTIDLKSFTSADVHTDGRILIKNYNSIFYWLSGEDILAQSPTRIPYLIEPQGESIAWDSLGGFYTLSEHNTNKKQILYYYAPRN